jgi:hypothetical protein
VTKPNRLGLWLTIYLLISLTPGCSNNEQDRSQSFLNRAMAPPELRRVARSIERADSILVFTVNGPGIMAHRSSMFPQGVPDSVRLVGILSQPKLRGRQFGYPATSSRGNLTSRGRTALMNLLADPRAYQWRLPDKCVFVPSLAFEFYQDGKHVADCLMEDNCRKWVMTWSSGRAEGNLEGLKEQYTMLVEEIGQR